MDQMKLDQLAKNFRIVFGPNDKQKRQLNSNLFDTKFEIKKGGKDSNPTVSKTLTEAEEFRLKASQSYLKKKQSFLDNDVLDETMNTKPVTNTKISSAKPHYTS